LLADWLKENACVTGIVCDSLPAVDSGATAMADFSEGYYPEPDIGLGYFGDRRLQKRGSGR
jgi:hypothetical protein